MALGVNNPGWLIISPSQGGMERGSTYNKLRRLFLTPARLPVQYANTVQILSSSLRALHDLCEGENYPKSLLHQVPSSPF